MFKYSVAEVEFSYKGDFFGDEKNVFSKNDHISNIVFDIRENEIHLFDTMFKEFKELLTLDINVLTHNGDRYLSLRIYSKEGTPFDAFFDEFLFDAEPYTENGKINHKEIRDEFMNGLVVNYKSLKFVK